MDIALSILFNIPGKNLKPQGCCSAKTKFKK